MATSETLTGKHERAPVERVMDSDIPIQSIHGKSRLGDLHLKIDKEVATGHAQWLQPGIEEEIDTQTRMDPEAPFVMDGRRPVLSARVAAECARILGQEWTEDEERSFADLVNKAEVRELEARKQFKVSSPERMGAQSKDSADTRWVLTWKEVDGLKTAKAQSAARGYQDPDLRMGNVDIAGCVSGRSSHLELISLGALKEWPLSSLDIKKPFLQVDGFDREVYRRAPCERNSKDSRLVWKLRAPAYGLNDAPVAYRRPPRKSLGSCVESPPSVGLRIAASSFDPRMYSFFRKSGEAAGAITTHIDNILGCGEAGLLQKARSL